MGVQGETDAASRRQVIPAARRRVGAPISFLALLLLLPPSADKRFQEGLELFKKKKYAEAHVKFSEACVAHRTQQCPKNLAMAELRLGRHAEAAMHFREYVRSPEFSTDADAGDLQKLYADERGKVGELRVVARDGAVVTVDSAPIGKAPLVDTWFVAPGKHLVSSSYADDTRTTEVEAVVGKTVEVDLSPPAVVAAPTATASSTATAAPTSTTAPVVPPPPSQTPKLIAGGTMLGVGVLGLGAWGLFAALSNGAKSDGDSQANSGACANPTDPRCLNLTDTVGRQNTFHTVSLVSLVGGLVCLAAGGAVTAWAANPKRERPALALTPSASADFLGLTVRGDFR